MVFLTCPQLPLGQTRSDPQLTAIEPATLVETLRETYGNGFTKVNRSDAQLGTVLDREGVSDLSELLKKK